MVVLPTPVKGWVIGAPHQCPLEPTQKKRKWVEGRRGEYARAVVTHEETYSGVVQSWYRVG